MKTWQTDGERNTNSAGNCIQGKPAPMFPEMKTFCWKLSLWSFSLCNIVCCQLLHWKGSFWYHFSLQHSIPQHRFLCLCPTAFRAAPNILSVNGEIRQLPWVLPAFEAAAVHLQHINAKQKESNASHSSIKIINIWLKPVELDGCKRRPEFHAKCPQKLWIIALCCNLVTDSIQEGNSFWCREQQFYTHLNFLLKSPGNYLSVRHPLAIQFF